MLRTDRPEKHEVPTTLLVANRPLKSEAKDLECSASFLNSLSNAENIPPECSSRLSKLEQEAHHILLPTGRMSPTRRLRSEQLSIQSPAQRRSDRPVILGPRLSHETSSPAFGEREKTSDLDLATALGHRMVEEVRRLQAELSNKEEELRTVLLESETRVFKEQEAESRIKNVIENEG
jgi:hypothetical protein